MENVLERPSQSQALTAQRPERKAIPLLRILAWLFLALLSLLFIVPFLWMVSTSLRDPTESTATLFPATWTLRNYPDAFGFGMWGQWAINSVIITAVSVLGSVLSTALVAYSFARLRWPGRDKMFSLVLATMMLPGIVTMIPTFILFSKLPAFGFQGSEHWTNTFLPLTIPAFAGNAFYIFLARQFMLGIPMELSEAAKIDGASELRIWWSIILPLTKPALAAIAIFAFQGAWEDFIGPLLYLQSEPLYTLQIALQQFQSAAGGAPNWPQLMAASLVIMMPVVVVFVAFQRYFIEGVTLTGMGGR
ncbi:MAG TPA: carbohydrate ABC transporter permease [Chloroflexia bacterium]|jgi:ABC-type glycerol-3-phosphate transport system permease component|nr:carbohydrate ABC transporter permease [Chloroflexia bacterium]